MRQSSAVLGDPDIFTMPVACHLAAAILTLCDQPPKRVLIFGMGGGMLPAFVQHHFPDAHITVVDLEKEVVRLALDHFNVKKTKSLETVISDGRRWMNAFVQGGLPASQRYDLIIQDACAGHPCSLVTAEAYAAYRDAALTDRGILMQNMFGASARVVRTMQHAFENLALLETGYESKIVIASKKGSKPLSHADAVSRAHFLKDMKVGPRCYYHGLRHGQTDDVATIIERGYSPANAPLLAVEIIRDSDPEVQDLEKKRWASADETLDVVVK